MEHAGTSEALEALSAYHSGGLSREETKLVPHAFTGTPIASENTTFYDIYKKRQELPVWPHKEEFISLLNGNQVVIVTGETGSGKTTRMGIIPRVPQWCWEFLQRKKRTIPKGTECDKEIDVSTLSELTGKLTLSEEAVTNAKERHSAGVDKEEEEEEEEEGKGGGEGKETLAGDVSGAVACTQPRRVAAIAAAKRVSDETCCSLGSHVGYKIRFDDCTSSETKIKFLTDGMLLQEATYGRPQLEMYDCIVLDEAHERSLSTDILFGVLKQILRRRKDLRVVVMSATLHAEKFASFFGGPPVMRVTGRMYPVDTFYTPTPVHDFFRAGVQAVFQIHWFYPPGDILLFLTGRADIDQACKELRKGWGDVPEKRLVFEGEESSPAASKGWRPPGKLHVFPLYSSLGQDIQRRVWDAPPDAPQRRVIVATNIAETSLTLDNIVYVVDPGFAKQKVYDPRSRMASLVVAPITQANANQRKGRAGRVARGTCLRLYTKESFDRLAQHPRAEIEVSNLAGVVLRLTQLRVTDLVHFPYVDPPAPEALMRALETLHCLGALSDEGRLTKLGSRMARFPLDPQMTKVVLASVQEGCTNEICSIAAMLAAPPVWVRPSSSLSAASAAHARFAHADGDHLTLLNVYHAYKNANADFQWCYDNFLNFRSLKEAERIRKQLVRVMNQQGLRMASNPFGPAPAQTKKYYKHISKAILRGFFSQVAFRSKHGHYIPLPEAQHAVTLHPSTSLRDKPQWVMYDECILTSNRFIRTVTRIKPEWLLEIAPNYFSLRAIRSVEPVACLQKVMVKHAKSNKQK